MKHLKEFLSEARLRDYKGGSIERTSYDTIVVSDAKIGRKKRFEFNGINNVIAGAVSNKNYDTRCLLVSPDGDEYAVLHVYHYVESFDRDTRGKDKIGIELESHAIKERYAHSWSVNAGLLMIKRSMEDILTDCIKKIQKKI